MNSKASSESLELLDSHLDPEKLKKVCILTTDQNPAFAKAICDRLRAPLSEMHVTYFSNGEARPKIVPSVHGKQIFLISTISPACRVANYKSATTINDELMGLFLTMSALKRAGAKKVTLILPSYPYARQDKKDEPHAAISASDIGRMLCISGLSHLICLDLHAAAIQGFFPAEIPVDNLYALAPIVEHVNKYVFTNPKYTINDSPEESSKESSKESSNQYFIAVAPDEGAFKRTKKYADSLNLPCLCLTKTRDYSRMNFVDESKTQIVGDTDLIKNRWSIVIDDMCDTFGTIQAAGKKLVEAGSKGVIVIVTHGILSGPAIERLNNTPEVVELICSDSLPQDENKKLSPKISTFSVTQLLAEVIRRRLCRESVSEIFYHT